MRKYFDFTPIKYRCASLGSMCPALLKTEHGTFRIIGTVLDAEEADLAERTADYERVVEIPAELLEEAAEAILKQRGISL
jgi:hypothetical protein